MKYAKDAGYETVVELLGGEEEGWIDVEEVYTGVDAGDYVEVSGPTGGLWVRHMDPQTELAYYMNDETGKRPFDLGYCARKHTVFKLVCTHTYSAQFFPKSVQFSTSVRKGERVVFAFYYV